MSHDRHRNGPVGMRRLPHLTMYIRGATSVQCSCCHTVNLALEGIGSSMNFKCHCMLPLFFHFDHPICQNGMFQMVIWFVMLIEGLILLRMGIAIANQVAHVNCGNCRMLLMYQYGARSVKCAVCNFVTSVGVSLIFLSSDVFGVYPLRCPVIIHRDFRIFPLDFSVPCQFLVFRCTRFVRWEISTSQALDILNLLHNGNLGFFLDVAGFVKHTGTEVHQLELAINLPVTGLTTHG